MANVGGRTIINHAEIEQLAHGDEIARDLSRSAELGTQEAKRLAPVSPQGSGGNGSGFLRSSLHWDLGQDSRSQYADIIADADYALFVELGTAPHVIESHGDYPLRNRKGQVFGKRVNHPGTDAQPFLRPGADRAARG